DRIYLGGQRGVLASKKFKTPEDGGNPGDGGDDPGTEPDDVTSIEESGKEDLELFPNPATDAVVLSSSQPLQRVQVLDAMGKYIVDVSTTSSTYILGMKTWPAGLYYVRINREGSI